jgi:two-component system response regulator FixJ
MSGIELHNQLIAVDCHVPIIFISGHGDDDLRNQALEAGAVDFLHKPFSEQAMLNALYLSIVMRDRDLTDIPNRATPF